MEAIQQIDILLWNPHGNQLKIVEDHRRFIIAVCGRRFGKTHVAVNKLVEEGLATEDGLFFYVAPYLKQAKQIAWELLKKQVKKLPKELVHKINDSELFVEIGNRTRIYIKGADNPESLRGVGLDGAVLDEYQDMKPYVFQTIIRPALMDKRGWCLFIGTPKGFNHLYGLFSEATKRPETWGVYHFTSYDNPLISREELEMIRLETDGDVWAQEYMAEFRKMKGLVYKDFDQAENAEMYRKLRPERFVRVICGMDFGFTNPASLIVIGQDSDGRYFAIDEYYQTGKTTDELVEVAKRFIQQYAVEIFYPDPAEPDRIEAMRRAGLNCRDVNKDIKAGIDRIRHLFKTNRLFINPECTYTIAELESYQYEDVKEELLGEKNPKEEPVKKDDHAMDALRYAIFSFDPVDRGIARRDEELSLYEEDYN